jgi:hypothetical protein
MAAINKSGRYVSVAIAVPTSNITVPILPTDSSTALCISYFYSLSINAAVFTKQFKV